MKVDLSQYETVKERKAKFYKDYPKGSIIVELLNLDSINTHAVFKASVFESKEDQEKNLPRGIGYALEIRDKEKSISSKGNEYESVNYTSWTENCEESSVGRALDNAGYAGNMKASREEMVKAQHHANTLESHSTAPQTPEPDWMDKPQVNETPAMYATDKQVKFIHKLLDQKGQKKEDLYKKYDVESVSNLSLMDAKQIIDNLLKLEDKLPERDIYDDVQLAENEGHV